MEIPVLVLDIKRQTFFFFTDHGDRPGSSRIQVRSMLSKRKKKKNKTGFENWELEDRNQIGQEKSRNTHSGNFLCNYEPSGVPNFYWKSCFVWAGNAGMSIRWGMRRHLSQGCSDGWAPGTCGKWEQRLGNLGHTETKPSTTLLIPISQSINLQSQGFVWGGKGAALYS